MNCLKKIRCSNGKAKIDFQQLENNFFLTADFFFFNYKTLHPYFMQSLFMAHRSGVQHCAYLVDCSISM